MLTENKNILGKQYDKGKGKGEHIGSNEIYGASNQINCGDDTPEEVRRVMPL